MAAGLLVAMAGSAVPAIGAAAVTFSIDAGACGATVHAPAGEVRVVRRNAAGKRLGAATVTVGGSGFAFLPCGSIGRLRAHDRLEASLDGVPQRLFVMPAFSLRFDRGGNRLIGRGPATELVRVSVDECVPGRITCYGSLFGETIPVGADGRFDVVAAGGYDLMGGSWARMAWQNTFGDDVHLRRSVPFLAARAGQAVVRGEADAGRRVAVTLRRGGSLIATGQGVAGRDGTFTVRLRRDGRAMRVRVGDRVSADLTGDRRPDASVTVFRASVGLDTAGDSVTFRCLPSGAYGAYVTPTTEPRWASWGNVTADGSKVVVHGFDVVPGWRSTLWCGGPQGDWIIATGRV